MTTIKLIKCDGNIVGFDVSGHSGYAESGSDIVCAAISSVVGLTETIINDSFGCKADVTVDPETARITLRLSEPCDICRSVLEAFERYVCALREEYPKHIKILEVQSNA